MDVICSSVDQTSNFIATGGENGIVGFWDVRNTATPIYCYDKHKKPVRRYKLSWCDFYNNILNLDIE